jgi:hypothetical protein
MERGEGARAVGTIIWVTVVAVLFTGFGLLFCTSVVRTLILAGAVAPEHKALAVSVVQVLAGLGELGISRLYRRATRSDNLGSLAAWLAGWALLLLGSASLAGRLWPPLALGMLAAALGYWVGRQLLSARRSGGRGR